MVNNPRAIFAAAINQPVADRVAWVQKTCGADVDLCRRVQDLLAAYVDENDSFLEQPAITLTLAPAGDEGTLGDFRLVREIGRGGMGIVYEAEQISLKRRVALKVLPFAAVLDKRQLQRFNTEAMAAARLHHQHIVPVYQVGCERAVHFYAMQYIDGRNVAELIRETRRCAGLPAPGEGDAAEPFARTGSQRPVLQACANTAKLCDISTDYSVNRINFHRRVAELGVQAAQALDFAHQHGILHRDIKPSNLMLDDDGDLWITDFGLARIEGDDGLTMSGDLLGTLRYMSPEQALGKRVVIDQRTDVYSLGVSLYEMLTLRPAYSGADRAELLRQISFETPTPLRKHDTTIPADLETIVLTAMAREPHRRYETARECADDLQCFLDGKPIVAKPPSRFEVLQKWIARNKSQTAMAGLLLATLFAAAAAISLGSRENQIPISGAAAHSGAGATQPLTTSALPARAPAEGRFLPGIVPEPTPIPGVGRWQLITRKPRGFILSATRSPDGSLLALTESNNVRIYDASNLVLLHVLVGHTMEVRGVAWHPDGKRLASCSADGTVRLWTSSGAPTHVLKGHTEWIHRIAWRPDGTQLASVSGDGTARVWTSDGESIHSLDEAGREVTGLSWSPDGHLLATAGGDFATLPSGDPPPDNSLRIWNADTGKLLNRIPAPTSANSFWVKWHPDGHRLAVGYADGVCLFNSDGQPGPRISLDLTDPVASAWRPDGELLAIGNATWRSGHCYFWQPGQQSVSQQNVTDESPLFSIEWTRDGSKLLASSRRSVFEWDGSSIRTLVASIGDESGARGHAGIYSVSWSPDGKHVSGREAHGAQRFWSSDGVPQPPLEHPAGKAPAWWEADSAEFRPDGTPWPRGKEIAAGAGPSVDWSNTGCLAAITEMDSPQGSSVQIWNASGELVSTLRDGRRTECVSWSPDGQRLALMGNSSIRIYTPDGTPGLAIFGHPDGWADIAWSPDGNRIASSSYDSTIWLWRPDGSLDKKLLGHQGCIGQLAWSPDSRKLGSSGVCDGTLRVWDVETGRTEWQALRVAPHSVVTMNRVGQFQPGNDALIESEMQCLLERPDGSMEIVPVSDFLSRHGAALVSEFARENDEQNALLALNSLLNAQNSSATANPELKPGCLGRDTAEFFLNRKCYREAALVYTCVLPFQPAAHLFKRRGAAHMALKEYDKAFADIAKAVELQPEDTTNFTWFDQALLWESPPEVQDNFLALATRAIELSPVNYAVRARYFEHRGEDDKARADWEAAVRARPADPSMLNSVAWGIVSQPCSQDAARHAVELALHAAKLIPDDVSTRNTLGTALYRAGDYQGAIENLQKSEALGSSYACCDFFFLAMAHWRLGRHEEAREWFDKAVSWMEANKSGHAEIYAFRREAEDLLGIKPELRADATPP